MVGQEKPTKSNMLADPQVEVRTGVVLNMKEC
jgi:hypothetical protein